MPTTVVIVGTTGAGKTRLSVDVALAVDGEIVSADAFQVYRGLEVASNAATPEERKGVPHHMIGVVDVDHVMTVTCFRDMAVPIIQDIHRRGKVAVIVGGTNYYIEALLWRALSDDDDGDGDDGDGDDGAGAVHASRADEEEARPSGSGDGDESLYAQLKRVDPLMAKKLHENDDRKIRRALEVYRETGKQASAFGVGREGRQLRFEGVDTVVFWPVCDKDVLDERLDRRVDEMVEAGLVDEGRRAWERVKETIACDMGVRQAIGLRQLEGHFEGVAPLDACLNEVKTATRRYARKQLSWIRRRLIGPPSTKGLPPMYTWNSTNALSFDALVSTPACAIAMTLKTRSGQLPAPLVASTHPTVLSDALERTQQSSFSFNGDITQWRSFRCLFCEKRLSGLSELEAHTKGNKHKAMRKRERAKGNDSDPIQEIL